MTKAIKATKNNSKQGISNKYALCVVDVPHLGTRTFSYIIPDYLQPEINVGQAVLVPFGKSNRTIIAFVVGFSNELDDGITPKEITKIIDKKAIFSINYLKMLEWISNYYCCDINYVIQAAIPMKFLKEDSKSVKTEKTEKYVIFKTKENAKSRQLNILEKLEELKEIKITEFLTIAKTTRPTLLKLEEQGFIEIIDKSVFRNPLNIFENIKKDEFPQLSDEQEKAFKEISSKIDNGQTEPILLNGITGSGKTEIYFKLIQKVLNEGKNVLFLAPEIALASQLTLRLIKRFNQEDIAIWHSSISEGEKFDVWNKIRDKKIRIIIGARSAVFAPLDNIGLVIIDEEHENTYKQTSPAPRYDSRVVAAKICEINNASLILGSATPDVGSYYKALSNSNLITLKNRFNANLAKVSIIDMRNEYNKEFHSLFSRSLINAVNETLNAKKQTILLMNRRGFFTNIHCQNCGEVIKCPKCDIPMVYHDSEKILKCHWCDSVKSVPNTCTECGSENIKMTGMGTQRIENITQKLFPNAKVARIDSDVLSSKYKYVEILEKFQNGEIDILIGTQMIAKGLDNPNVTLVGVIDSDISFALPDYRSSERGFQLLMQVAGRAGRGDLNGNVIFQTYNPDLYAIKNAKSQNYIDFYNNEISRRELFDYPPFCQIIKIVISSKNETRAQICTEEITKRFLEQIDKLNLSEFLEINGALKCIMYKINSEYRYQIIIKNKLKKKGQYVISTLIKNMSIADDIKMIVDIDPVDVI